MLAWSMEKDSGKLRWADVVHASSTVNLTDGMTRWIRMVYPEEVGMYRSRYSRYLVISKRTIKAMGMHPTSAAVGKEIPELPVEPF